MEILYNSIQTTLESFDFAYCISVNLATYFAINLLSHKNKAISVWYKRLVLLIAIIVIGAIYSIAGCDTKVLLNSAILAPVFWSWVLKPVCKLFNIDYSNIARMK